MYRAQSSHLKNLISRLEPSNFWQAGGGIVLFLLIVGLLPGVAHPNGFTWHPAPRDTCAHLTAANAPLSDTPTIPAWLEQNHGIIVDPLSSRRSGMSVSYSATARRDGKIEHLFVKIPLPDPTAIQALRNEARVLSHFNQMRFLLLEEGAHENEIVLVQELIPVDSKKPGTPCPSLWDLKRSPSKTGVRFRSRLNNPTYTALFEKKIIAAVKNIHEKNISHLDLTPKNILIQEGNETTPGDTFIIDFGLSRLRTDIDMPKEGLVLGTYPYIAPETFLGYVSSRADVYALQQILFYLYAPDAWLSFLENPNLTLQDELADFLALRQVHDSRFRNFAGSMENHPTLKAEKALLLNSMVPETIDELDFLLDTTSDPDVFKKNYLTRWKLRFEKIDPRLSGLLIFELVSSPRLGAEIYRELDADQKSIIIEAALRWQNATGFTSIEETYGPKISSEKVITRFLNEIAFFR